LEAFFYAIKKLNVEVQVFYIFRKISIRNKFEKKLLKNKKGFNLIESFFLFKSKDFHKSLSVTIALHLHN